MRARATNPSSAAVERHAPSPGTRDATPVKPEGSALFHAALRACSGWAAAPRRCAAGGCRLEQRLHYNWIAFAGVDRSGDVGADEVQDVVSVPVLTPDVGAALAGVDRDQALQRVVFGFAFKCD